MIDASNTARSFGVVMLAMALACSGDKGNTAATLGTKKPARADSLQQSGGDVVIHGDGSAYRVISVPTPATVSGTVTLKGSPQAAAPIATGSVGPICGAAVVDESLQLTGNALGGVVVWIDSIRAGKALPDVRRLELESVQCKLRPRVQGALMGSSVNILGHDQFMQHLRFTAGGEPSPRATVLLGGGEQVIPTELPFKAPGLVVVRDPEHAWTRAYLAVFDHPYYAVTASNGSFSIDGVPPGKYTVHTWHERTGESAQQITVPANGALKLSLELKAK